MLVAQMHTLAHTHTVILIQNACLSNTTSRNQKQKNNKSISRMRVVVSSGDLKEKTSVAVRDI